MTAEEAMFEIEKILIEGFLSSSSGDGEYTDGEMLDDIYTVYEKYCKSVEAKAK